MSRNSYNNLLRLGLAVGFVPALIFIAQPARADTIQVTVVRLNPTDKGIEVVLETADGQVPQVFTSAYGKTSVADVIVRNPEVIVISEAFWSPAQRQVQLFQTNPAFSQIKAVQQQGFIIINYRHSTSVVSVAEGIRQLAQGLYPERFK